MTETTMRADFEKWAEDYCLTDPHQKQDCFFAWQAAKPQWQPMETAPRDGSPILVYHNCMILETWYSSKWERFVVSETGGTNGIKPTHWMPLPTPPTIRQGNKA